MKVVFVGGVHGVGKSTICRTICNDLDFCYLSASELIKWPELNDDSTNKLVKDIAETQERLIEAVNSYKQKEGKYLLDGHFCLFNIKSDITKISFRTFELIDPTVICVVIANPDEIVISQRARRGQVFDVDVIAEMQNLEVDHAQRVANHLKIPFIQVTRFSTALLKAGVQNAFKL